MKRLAWFFKLVVPRSHRLPRKALDRVRIAWVASYYAAKSGWPFGWT